MAAVDAARLDAEPVRAGLANFSRAFAHPNPFDQRDLVRPVLRRARLGDRELVVEMYGGALGGFAGDGVGDDGQQAADGVAVEAPGA